MELRLALNFLYKLRITLNLRSFCFCFLTSGITGVYCISANKVRSVWFNFDGPFTKYKGYCLATLQSQYILFGLWGFVTGPVSRIAAECAI